MAGPAQQSAVSTPAVRSRSPESASRPPKRRRGIACSECRDRKIRCDGARPICDSCSRRNLTPDRCIYAESDRPGTIASSRYTRELEKRVHQLEASIQEKGSSATRVGDAFRSPGHSTLYGTPLGASHKQPHTRPSLPSHSSGRLNGDGDGDEDDDADRSPYPTEPRLPVGESSISGFLKQAQETLEHRNSSKAGSSSHGESTMLNSHSSPMRRSDFNLTGWQHRPRNEQRLMNCTAAVMLPSREHADQLLEAFWRYEYPLMPIFHRPTFLRKYNRLWEVSDAEIQNNSYEFIFEKASFYCILCAVLAMSYRNLAPSRLEDSEGEASGMALLERSRQLLYSGLLESATVEVVQGIIFMAMFLRRKGNHHEAWIFIGLASRVAQALGIQYATDEGSQSEREIKRRTWYGCVILDCLHTTVFGQVPIAAGGSLPLPSMIDDIYMETDPEKPDREQPAGETPDIAFFVAITKLCRVSVNILRAIYNSNYASLKDIPSLEFRTAIFVHDGELQQWKNDLPLYLRRENLDENPEELRLRWTVYLQVRQQWPSSYLDCRFLLFRAAILRLAGQPDVERSVLQEGITRACIESCISSIRELVDIFRKYRYTVYIPGPKHNVVCLLTAATVLALVVRSHFLSRFTPRDDESAYINLLSDCMKLLRSYDRRHFPMRRKGAADAVEALMRVNTDAETQDRTAEFAMQQSAVAVASSLDRSNQKSATHPETNETTAYSGTDNAIPLLADIDLFNTPDFFGDLTGDLQNPATWATNELDPYGLSFTGAFTMQDVLGPMAGGFGNMPGDSTADYWQQYGTQWWQPPG